MSAIYDCSDATALLEGMRLARAAIGRGELVVLPTDTVYGVAADAFNPEAVKRLVEAKGRTLASPPPVLIPGMPMLDALAETVPDPVRALVEEFWPGGLTVIVQQRSSLALELGETHGTVALRMPDDKLARDLLAEVGPLAVSSANRTGEPPAQSATAAEAMLGDSVTIYLEDGPRTGVSSTIVDASNLDRPEGRLRILREGTIPRAELARVVGEDLLA